MWPVPVLPVLVLPVLPVVLLPLVPLEEIVSPPVVPPSEVVLPVPVPSDEVVPLGGRLLVGKLPVGKLLVGELPVGKLLVDGLLLGSLLVGGLLDSTLEGGSEVREVGGEIGLVGSTGCLVGVGGFAVVPSLGAVEIRVLSVFGVVVSGVLSSTLPELVNDDDRRNTAARIAAIAIAAPTPMSSPVRLRGSA